MFLSLRTTSGAIFTKIEAFLGELGPKKTQEIDQFMDAPSPRKPLKIYNLRTTNAMKMKVDTIVYLYVTFHLTRDLGVLQRGLEGVAGKRLKKKNKKIVFLTPNLGISNNKSKPVKYVILCLALHHW